MLSPAPQAKRGITMSIDSALEAWVRGLIELSKFKWMLGAGRRWRQGKKLKLFFARYNGMRARANRPAGLLWYDFGIGEP